MKIPFTASARTAMLIGSENFSNPEGAIIELVKNAEVEAVKRKTIEIRNHVSKIEEDAQKQISDPNFPEVEKQQILAKMRVLKSM